MVQWRSWHTPGRDDGPGSRKRTAHVAERGFESEYDRYEEDYDRDRRRYRIEAAKGLQAVEGLETSPEFDAVSEGYVEGAFGADELRRQVAAYYELGDGDVADMGPAARYPADGSAAETTETAPCKRVRNRLQSV